MYRILLTRGSEEQSQWLVTFMCFIPGSTNPADGMTKAKPNRMLENATRTNHLSTPAKRLLMLQKSPFRHATYIPTSFVPMRDDQGSPFRTRGGIKNEQKFKLFSFFPSTLYAAVRQ